MFANISTNPQEMSGKRIHENARKIMGHHYSLGNTDWQQKHKTSKQRDFGPKDVSKS